MRRLLACAVFGAVLACVPSVPPVLAQQAEAARQEQNAAEFQRLLRRVQRVTDPEQAMAAADQALKNRARTAPMAVCAGPRGDAGATLVGARPWLLPQAIGR